MNHSVHKYKRIRTGKKKDYFIFRCFLPNCNHYIPEDFIIGKMSICWKCESTFVIEKNRRKPICRVCWNRLYGKEDVSRIIDKILGEKII